MNDLAGKRIVLAIDGEAIGGGQKHVHSLALFLKREGYQVTVLCSSKGPLSDLLSADGIAWDVVPMGKVPLFRQLRKWKEKLAQLRPDVLHLHGAVAGFWGRYFTTSPRSYKVMYTVHGIHFIHRRNFIVRWLYHTVEKWLDRKTDMVICVCESDRQKFIQLGVSRPAKIQVVSNGINLQEIAETVPLSREAIGVKSNELVLSIVARLHRQKGHVYAIEALSKLISNYPSAKLLIAGEGEGRVKLEAHVKRLNLGEHVKFLGFVEKPASVLKMSNVHLMPSLWEGQPLSLMEAMAAGVPTIASNVDGIPEVATDEAEALLVPPHDSETLAAEVQRLCGDSSLRHRLIDAGRKRAKSFDERLTLKPYLELYQRLETRSQSERDVSIESIVAPAEIALDVRMVRSTGIGSTIRGLLDHLSDDRLKRMQLYGLPEWENPYSVTFLPTPFPVYSLAQHWAYASLLGRRRPQLFHMPHYDLPLLYKGPFVATVHDLIHVLYPQYSTKPFSRLYASIMLRHVAKHARRIIAVSENTRQDIIHFFPEAANKIRVIYPGVDQHFRPLPPSERVESIRRWGLKPGYLLYVGNLRGSKNTPGLLEAYSRARRLKPDLPPLVLVGHNTYRRLTRNGFPENVRYLGPVRYDDLPTLYSCASLFLFPSFYEGFGLPPVEAMACGVPILISKVASLPEVGGDVACYCDPSNTEDIANKIVELIQDRARLADMSRRGIERARRFSWANWADETWKVYEEALEEIRNETKR